MGKKNSKTLIICLFGAGLGAMLYAGEISFTVDFHRNDLFFSKYQEYDIISLRSCDFTSEID